MNIKDHQQYRLSFHYLVTTYKFYLNFIEVFNIKPKKYYYIYKLFTVQQVGLVYRLIIR